MHNGRRLYELILEAIRLTTDTAWRTLHTQLLRAEKAMRVDDYARAYQCVARMRVVYWRSTKDRELGDVVSRIAELAEKYLRPREGYA